MLAEVHTRNVLKAYRGTLVNIYTLILSVLVK
jgi:hypothetical protein